MAEGLEKRGSGMITKEDKKGNSPKGLFVGLCTKDIVYYTDEIPGKNHKIKTDDFATYIGGPAANAAITYAALGGDATLATCLGVGPESEAMVKELNAYGVKVLNYADYETTPNTACILVSKDGSRSIISGQHPFTPNRTFDISAFDFILFDCNQQEISQDILAQSQGQTIVLDAGSVKPGIEAFLQKADIVIASEDFRGAMGEGLFRMQCDAPHKAVTHGERPILYNGKELSVSKVTAVDTLGAGDIFHGAFCYGRFHLGKTVEEALLFAAEVAGESVKYRGPRAWIKEMKK